MDGAVAPIIKCDVIRYPQCGSSTPSPLIVGFNGKNITLNNIILIQISNYCSFLDFIMINTYNRVIFFLYCRYPESEPKVLIVPEITCWVQLCLISFHIHVNVNKSICILIILTKLQIYSLNCTYGVQTHLTGIGFIFPTYH